MQYERIVIVVDAVPLTKEMAEKLGAQAGDLLVTHDGQQTIESPAYFAKNYKPRGKRAPTEGQAPEKKERRPRERKALGTKPLSEANGAQESAAQ